MLNRDYKVHQRYYCSQFVRACLVYLGIQNVDNLPKIIKPIDFLKLEYKTILFKGFLKNCYFDMNQK